MNDPRGAPDGGERRAGQDEQQGDADGTLRSANGGFNGRANTGGGENGHTVRLGHGPAEILRESDCASEDSNVGRHNGAEGGAPSEFAAPIGPGDGISGED